MNATVVSNEFPVRHAVRLDIGREFITFDVPNGWEDVQKISKKVLLFDGRKFVFAGWNSDHNYCSFYRPLNGVPFTASFE